LKEEEKKTMRPYAMMIFMVWSEVFAVIFLLAGIIFGTLGASNYIRNRNDEQTYRPWKTLCIVRNYTSKRCDYRWFSDCYDRYPCFNEEYLVDYEIFNKTIVRSSIKTKNQINLNRKQNDTCYYDGRHNLTSVKWNYADKTLGLILFCIGYGTVAVVLPIIVIILIFLIIERRHQQIENSSIILR
jgi:hypothetical protein